MSKDYSVSHCSPTHEGDEDDFLSIKHYHNNVFMYCPYKTIKIREREFACPQDKIIQLPTKTDFQIDNDLYQYSQLRIIHRQISDPIFTFHANMDILPTFNLKQVLEDLESAENHIKDAEIHVLPELELEKENEHFLVKLHRVVTIISGSLLFLLTVAAIFRCCYSIHNG